MRSLQPRYVRHLMGSTHADFGSLVQALYNVQESISQEVWPKSSLSDSKIKKSSGVVDRTPVTCSRPEASHTPITFAPRP
ncbi:hypothetical protein CK203_062997 [Vitis vinifera]|uniref:Uncharacterized protein n=1 Tax=Vitis vinifera TaxID=29760 RepID=A0A438G949_VITVI|nr:hypothetical protein CK203_062997 [Vitis vinifera]